MRIVFSSLRRKEPERKAERRHVETTGTLLLVRVRRIELARVCTPRPYAAHSHWLHKYLTPIAQEEYQAKMGGQPASRKGELTCSPPVSLVVS